MTDKVFSNLVAGYRWDLSLLTLVLVFAVPFVLGRVLRLVPTIGRETARNSEAYRGKMQKPAYAENQAWNRKWGGLFVAAIFGLVIPFCLTLEPQPWWRLLVDTVVILMVYDFVYYLTHRFVFHAGGPFDGPLMWMHAVHHRQHNPCKMDSSYIHPLEVAIGLGLYVSTIFFLSLLMGRFHVATIVITWTAFSTINLHNHNLWESNRFPFRYLNYAAQMHHNHHARFTGGNYATITLIYDWMFGTLDDGTAPRKPVKGKTQPESWPAEA